jgi:hypothetical protein
MVLNPATMHYLFPPIKLGAGFGSTAYAVFSKIDGEPYLAVSLYNFTHSTQATQHQLQLFDRRGKLIKKRYLQDSSVNEICFIHRNMEHDHSFWLIDNRGVVYQTDTSLRLKPFFIPAIEDYELSPWFFKLMDINHDGENEFLFFGFSKTGNVSLIIYPQNLKAATLVELPHSKGFVNNTFNVIYPDKKHTVLKVQNEGYTYSIIYSKNPYYFLKFPFYGVLYLFIYLVFWVLQSVQNKYARRKYDMEKQLIRQQMAIAKKQLEPHFILNTMNYLGYLFSQENKEEAQYYLGKLSVLINRGLQYADKTETTLFEEFQFVKDYLILQRKRFDDDLEFSIEAEDDVDLKKILIPHSLIYTFVENAVKHGLLHRPNHRKLTIFAQNSQGKTVITITDNGIGRKQAGLLKTNGTGKGLSIISNIIDGYNKLNKRHISFSVNDLVDENEQGTGTKVVVEV